MAGGILQGCDYPTQPRARELALPRWRGLGLGPLSVAISHSSVMLREWIFALNYSSEGSLLSRAQNLPSQSAISQHAALCRSFRNAQLRQCTRSGGVSASHTISRCSLQGPTALKVHFISSVYISVPLDRVKAYHH